MRWFSAGAWGRADTGLGQWTPALLPSSKSPSKPPGAFSHGFSACKGCLPAEPGHEGLLPAASKPQKHKSDGKTLVSETVAAAAKSLQSYNFKELNSGNDNGFGTGFAPGNGGRHLDLSLVILKIENLAMSCWTFTKLFTGKWYF